MQRIQFIGSQILAITLTSVVWAASPGDRLKGVATFAKTQKDDGPDHVVIGLAVALGCALLIALGAALRGNQRTR